MSLNRLQLHQALHAILDPMGFETDPDVIAAIGYRGTVHDRLLRVSGAIRRRHVFTGYDNTSVRINTGVMVSIETDTPVATRLTVGTSPLGWLAKKVVLPRLGLRPVTAPDGIDAWASEEDWAQRYMATDAFRELAAKGADLSVSAFVFTPVKVSLTCAPRTDQLNAATVTRWLELLTQLVTQAEADPPSLVAERTWLERQSRGTQLAIIVGALFGVPLLLLGCFGLAILGVIALITIFL